MNYFGDFTPDLKEICKLTMKTIELHANGINFSALEAGNANAPLVVLLHGFPDNAYTWDKNIPALVNAGFRVVAPFLRGYPPTEIPADNRFDYTTLALDVKCIIEILSDEPAFLIGQDWGAAITYGVLAAFPEIVKKAVVMAIPHPAMVRLTLTDPAQIHRAFHWWFFQLPELPETAVAADDFAFIDYLWNDWSPNLRDEAHIKQVKAMLAQPGALKSALAYYRNMLQTSNANADLEAIDEKMKRPISVPMLAICGADDIRGEVLAAQQQFFSGEYDYQTIPSCRHFLHREKPEEVNELIINWLKN